MSDRRSQPARAGSGHAPAGPGTACPTRQDAAAETSRGPPRFVRTGATLPDPPTRTRRGAAPPRGRAAATPYREATRRPCAPFRANIRPAVQIVAEVTYTRRHHQNHPDGRCVTPLGRQMSDRLDLLGDLERVRGQPCPRGRAESDLRLAWLVARKTPRRRPGAEDAEMPLAPRGGVAAGTGKVA